MHDLICTHCKYSHCICTDDQVTSSLHTVLEPFLLRRVKSEVNKIRLIQYLHTPLSLSYTGVAGSACEERSDTLHWVVCTAEKVL